MFANFFVRPAQHEQIETTAVLRQEEPPVLLGTVTDAEGRPYAGALAVLYAAGGTKPDTVAGIAYSDTLGRFAFGPLEAGTLYQVSIYADSMQRRVLEQPEET